MMARFTLAAVVFVFEFGDGLGDGEFDCEAAEAQRAASAHTSQSSCFMVDVPSVTG
jgi:hypothetical protein